jgi:hypothetical protein
MYLNEFSVMRLVPMRTRPRAVICVLQQAETVIPIQNRLFQQGPYHGKLAPERTINSSRLCHLTETACLGIPSVRYGPVTPIGATDCCRQCIHCPVIIESIPLVSQCCFRRGSIPMGSSSCKQKMLLTRYSQALRVIRTRSGRSLPLSRQ